MLPAKVATLIGQHIAKTAHPADLGNLVYSALKAKGIDLLNGPDANGVGTDHAIQFPGGQVGAYTEPGLFSVGGHVGNAGGTLGVDQTGIFGSAHFGNQGQ